MSTVLPREEAVETIFSKILASPEASGRLSGVFYDHIDDDHRLTDNDRDHFLQVLFHAYQNGDISALLLELCGRSMFDLLREAYLIPKKFHGKAGREPGAPYRCGRRTSSWGKGFSQRICKIQGNI
ncbi:DUF4866 domain-containing protein [Blautia wexlerae]|nr:DUF4866 domain-containing protein [Blautia wexlerae]